MLPLAVEEAKACCPKSPLASAVIVKHTFIDLEDEYPEEHHRRRSKSTPPGRTRKERQESAFLLPKQCKASGDTSGSSTSSGTPRETSGSDCASEDRMEHRASVELASPSGGLNPNAPVWSPTNSGSSLLSWNREPASPLCAPCAPSSPALVPTQNPAFYQLPPGSPQPGPPSPAPNQAFNEQALIAPPPPPPPPSASEWQYPPVSSQHRLNVNAKAWQPGSPMTMQGQGGPSMMPVVPPPPPAQPTSVWDGVQPKFRFQFEALLKSTKQALLNAHGVVGVEVFENSSPMGKHMSIVAWAQREELQVQGTHEQICKQAKDAINRFSENSQGTYVMGYKYRPFSQTDFGFATTLGGMRDEKQACWDMFTRGNCRREWDCRWQHAACLLPIQVEVRPSQE